MSSKATETTDNFTAPIGISNSKNRRFRNINGVMHYSCRLCDELKPETEFWKDKRGEARGSIPVRAYCKPCQKNLERKRRNSKSAAERKALVEKYANRARERQEELKKLDKELRQKIKSTRIVELPEWVIERLREDIKTYQVLGENNQVSLGTSAFAEQLGIGQDVLSRIIHGRKTRVSREFAEKIYMHCEAYDELDELFPVIASEKWAKDWDCCQQCGTIKVRHSGKGLCSTCKSRINRGCPPRLAEKQWSTFHPKCLVCDRTDRKHSGRGLCRACYCRMKRRLKDLFDKHYPANTNRLPNNHVKREASASTEFHL